VTKRQRYDHGISRRQSRSSTPPSISNPFDSNHFQIALTGAASGIGLATAHVLASRGAKLALADFNGDGLKKQAADLPNASSHTTTVLDVCDPQAVNDWIAATVSHFGTLNGAANIAGVHRENGRMLIDALDEDYDFVMGVNAKGVFNCLRAELRAMDPSVSSSAPKPSAQGKGCSIVNLASVAGLTGLPTSAAYCMSKHAVVGLTRVAAKEMGTLEHGAIRINAVCPGVIDTPMVQNLEKERGGVTSTRHQIFERKADPKEVAQIVAFLLSDESTFVNGSCYRVDAGWRS
jgi:NAD(P)-dependent dehydrogenase (short-subunit alcohol dehydrogenase family)